MKTAKGSLLLRIPVMILGSSMIAVGVYFFKIPNGFSTGGVSGISTVLGKAIPNAYVTPGTLITAINVLLLIIGFFVVGKSFSVRTVFCSLLFSLETLGFEKWIPLDQPITNQPFLELVYAILLTSIGSSILFYVNASSGGTDIVALILKKYTRLDTGKALLCTDFLIACSSFFVFGVTAGLFSLLGLFAKAFLVDSVIESLSVCKCFLIVTEKPDEISRHIIEKMGHTTTILDATGGYSHDSKPTLVTVCRRIEGIRLRRAVREIDPKAFVIILNSSEIVGRGFRSV